MFTTEYYFFAENNEEEKSKSEESLSSDKSSEEFEEAVSLNKCCLRNKINMMSKMKFIFSTKTYFFL